MYFRCSYWEACVGLACLFVFHRRWSLLLQNLFQTTGKSLPALSVQSDKLLQCFIIYFMCSSSQLYEWHSSAIYCCQRGPPHPPASDRAEGLAEKQMRNVECHDRDRIRRNLDSIWATSIIGTKIMKTVLVKLQRKAEYNDKKFITNIPFDILLHRCTGRSTISLTELFFFLTFPHAVC